MLCKFFCTAATLVSSTRPNESRSPPSLAFRCLDGFFYSTADQLCLTCEGGGGLSIERLFSTPSGVVVLLLVLVVLYGAYSCIKQGKNDDDDGGDGSNDRDAKAVAEDNVRMIRKKVPGRRSSMSFKAATVAALDARKRLKKAENKIKAILVFMQIVLSISVTCVITFPYQFEMILSFAVSTVYFQGALE